MKSIIEQSLKTKKTNTYQTSEAIYPENYPTVTRTFAFIDIAGYTAYTHEYGTHAAAEKLHNFRNAVRETVGKYGVRVDKWLGDGVMLISVKARPVVAVVTELNKKIAGDDFRIHVGVATGEAVIFEGNDYVGEVINIASRLCDSAEAGEVLVYNVKRNDIPHNVHVKKAAKSLHIKDIGDLTRVQSVF